MNALTWTVKNKKSSSDKIVQRWKNPLTLNMILGQSILIILQLVLDSVECLILHVTFMFYLYICYNNIFTIAFDTMLRCSECVFRLKLNTSTVSRKVLYLDHSYFKYTLLSLFLHNSMCWLKIKKYFILDKVKQQDKLKNNLFVLNIGLKIVHFRVTCSASTQACNCKHSTR